MMISRLGKTSTVIALACMFVTGSAYAQETELTDLTGQDVSVDALVSALDIPIRGVGAKCGPYQEQMSRLTRGIGSEPPTKASQVPDLGPVKAAAVSATFNKNSATLTEDTKSLLGTVAIALNSPDLQAQCFQLAGHTCDLGDGGYNMSLSQRRADTVRDYLISQGVDKNRLVTTGFGETSPMVANASDESRQKNRRVDLGALPPVGLDYP